MKQTLAIIFALLFAAPCFGQAVAIPTAPPDPHGNLREIGQLADPGADRVLFWDDSAGEFTWLTMGTNLSISGTTLNASGGGGDVDAFAADPSTNGNFSASAWRTDLGLVIGTNVQAFDSDLTTWAGVTPSANGQSLVAAADYSAMRTLLSLVPGTNVQAYDADLDDLADGSLTGTKVAFADTNSDFSATNIQAAIEELVSVNGSGPNAADGKVDWSQLANVPAGFADGSDDGAGGGGGTMSTVKVGGSQVGDQDIVTLDFLAADFDASESPNTEINLSIDASITRDAEIDTSAELAGIVGDETGSGALVFGTSPTLTTPALGTPSSLTLTNATGLPISTGVSGLGTGVATALATPSSANWATAFTDETGSGLIVLATSPTLTTPNLGTPSAATLTNATGLPISTGVSGLGTGVATALATPSSANLAAAITDETGSGALVFGTSPTISGGTINNNVIGGTTPAAITGTTVTATTSVTTVDAAYNATTWNGDNTVPTKNAVRDKIESLTAGSAFGSVVVLHKDGTFDTYVAATDSDSDRGAALDSATDSIAAYDEVLVGPGVFDIGASKLYDSGQFPDNVSIRGSGAGTTTIKSQLLSANGVIYEPGDNNDLADLRLSASLRSGNQYQLLIGNNSSTTSGATGFRAQNVIFDGDSDLIYCQHTSNVFEGSFYDCRFETGYDVVAIGGPAHIIRIFNSRMIGTNVGTGLSGWTIRGLSCQDADCTLEVTGCDIDITMADNAGGATACYGYSNDGQGFIRNSKITIVNNQSEDTLATNYGITGSGTFSVENTTVSVTDNTADPSRAYDAAPTGAVTYVNCRFLRSGVRHTSATNAQNHIRSYIDSSASGLTKPPVDVTNAGLTLENCNVIAHSSATNGVQSTSDTVTVVGNLTYNKPPDGDTTFGGNGVLFDTSTSVATMGQLALGTDLSVANGGTGASTLTGLVKGNGTSAFTAATEGTDYYAPSGTDVAVADGGTGSSTAAGARSNLGVSVRTIEVALYAPTTAAATGDGKFYFRVPASMDAAVITSVHLQAVTAGTTGTTDVQIANVTDAVDVLSTKLTLDSTEPSSTTAATPAVINTSNDDLATGDMLRIDIDAVSTTPPQGLIVTIEVTK